jgi:hypothetical protein
MYSLHKDAWFVFETMLWFCSTIKFSIARFIGEQGTQGLIYQSAFSFLNDAILSLKLDIYNFLCQWNYCATFNT